MKILQLGKYYPPDLGGMETTIYNLTEGLNKRGIRCDVLCSNSKKEYVEEEINGYKVYRVKSYGKFASTSIAPQMIFKLREIIHNYDIVHVHLPDPMANFALLLSNVKNKKVIVHWHSDIVRQKYLLKLYEPFQNWLLKRADRIIATTPKYIEESKYLQKFKEKCVAIPIGIEESKLKIDENRVSIIKNQYRDKKIIFSLGRLVYYKGFKYLIESAKYLDDKYVILIGGDGPLKNNLEKLIAKYNLQNKVKLLGRIEDSDLGSYHAVYDVFCLPSISKAEAFGIVQVEAMSFGKPVVATKIKGSGVDWVNKDGVSGLNVEPKNPRALAEAFEKILSDENLYKTLSLNARLRFEQLFRIEKMIDDIIKLYEEILKKRL